MQRRFDLIGLLSKLLEPYTKEFKPTQGVVIFIAILVCVTFTIPSVLLHIQRMRELDNEYTRDRWAHEEALADDEIESRKLDIEENKAHADSRSNHVGSVKSNRMTCVQNRLPRHRVKIYHHLKVISEG